MKQIISFVFITIILFLCLNCMYISKSLNNMLPEIAGICIELIIIIYIVNKWEENKQKKKLINLEKRLREYLIFFLKHGFKDLPNEYRISNFYGIEHKKNIEELDKLILYINNNSLSNELKDSIKKHCKLEYYSLNNLLIISSKLSNHHFKSWSRIVYFVNLINYNDNVGKKDIIDILNNIKKFDKASYENKIYVEC